ncbi:MAG: Uma2 family endonuclease [Microcystis sp. 53602_E8]|nr:Uma2 family endonuclease [Microcystis sp. 53602_E8]
MAPSPEHEFSKTLIGRFVETLAEESAVPIYPLGSTTFKRPKLSGAEPDECFYIDNIEAVRGKKRLDFNEDPAPDLVIEIDVTSSSQNRLQVYADLGVAEVWVYNGESLVIQQLQNGTYIRNCYIFTTSWPDRLPRVSKSISELGKKSAGKIKGRFFNVKSHTKIPLHPAKNQIFLP